MGICEYERRGRAWWHEGLRANDAAMLSQLNWAEAQDRVQTSSDARSNKAWRARCSPPNHRRMAEKNSPDTQSWRSVRGKTRFGLWRCTRLERNCEVWSENSHMRLLIVRLDLTLFTTWFPSFHYNWAPLQFGRSRRRHTHFSSGAPQKGKRHVK